MTARAVVAATALWAMQTVFAQTPSWNSPGGRGSSLPAQQAPSGVARNAGNSTAAAATALQPPRDRDCSAITQAPDPFDPHPTKWYTDGTEDHGQILNTLGLLVVGVVHSTNDLQMRIAQLRCEQDNIKAKLDFLIRMQVR